MNTGTVGVESNTKGVVKIISPVLRVVNVYIVVASCRYRTQCTTLGVIQEWAAYVIAKRANHPHGSAVPRQHNLLALMVETNMLLDKHALFNT
jgi:hypothetical protein